jgi:hypothetical protein
MGGVAPSAHASVCSLLSVCVHFRVRMWACVRACLVRIVAVVCRHSSFPHPPRTSSCGMTRFAHHKAFQWDKMTKVAVNRQLGLRLIAVNFILFAIFFSLLVWMGKRCSGRFHTVGLLTAISVVPACVLAA